MWSELYVVCDLVVVVKAANNPERTKFQRKGEESLTRQRLDSADLANIYKKK